MIDIFGEVLASELTYEDLSKLLKRPSIKPRFRLNVLNRDESVNYIIPEEDIPINGISYTEDYQNGQRRNLQLQLINKNNKYNLSINNLWLTTRFRLDIGLSLGGSEVYWFPRGVYIMGDVSLEHSDSNNTITIQLKDKYAVFEGKMGTLEEAYEIPVDSKAEDVVNGLLNFSTGDGYILDYQPIIFDPSFKNFRIQSTIRVEEGGTMSEIIDAIATQLSAEYYYNNVGNLCFYPINYTIDDSNKPIIWTYSKLDRDIQNLNLNYKNEDVINVVKVVGDNVDSGIYSAIVTNENPRSPICIQQIGRRAAPKYQEANVWSDETALDLANYYLRQSSFIGIDFSCDVSYNPILAVNNIVEIENEFLNLKREKLLVTSISFTSDGGTMSLKMCNTAELPTLTR